MKLKFVNPYKSISQFDDVELPNFTVLTGLNGSGKTHILEAIKNGHIKVEGIDYAPHQNNIVYFNLNSFLLKNAKPVTPTVLNKYKEDAWQIVGVLKRDGLADLKDRIIAVTEQEPVRHLRPFLSSGILKSSSKLANLDKNEFLRNAKCDVEEYSLENALSEIFFEYQLRSLNPSNINEELTDAPWNILNKYLSLMDMPHRVTPPDFTLDDRLNDRDIEYSVSIDLDGSPIAFEDLSSGERILMALAFIRFFHDYKANPPELLMLDEVDAFLHPLMIDKLLSVIKDVFVDNGCNVILATHSPTMVTLVEDESIFEVKKGTYENKIVKIPAHEAVDLLSESFMTLAKGLTIFDKIKESAKELSIFSEGKNLKHIEKAISILEPSLIAKIDFVVGAESRSGQSDLVRVVDFFQLVPHPTNIVLFVFDWDLGSHGRGDLSNTYVFVFDKNNANGIAKKGIENIYPKSLFTGFTKAIPNMPGEVAFDYSNNKDAFLEEVLRSTNSADFINYMALVGKIKRILGVT